MGVLGIAVGSPAIVYTEGSSTRKWRYSWTTWEAEGRRGGIHAPRATTCIRSFHKDCWNVFVFRTTDEARLCFNARMIRICAHASPKNVIQGSGRACVPRIRVRELCHLIRAAFLKFLFTDRIENRFFYALELWTIIVQNFSFSSNFFENVDAKDYSIILQRV